MEKIKFINAIKEKTKKLQVYLQYTLIFTIIALASFYVYIKLGKSFIWNIDGFKQHYVILYDFHKMIKNIFQNGISLFSWNMGLGLDVIGQYSYYVLGDPFAYISLLFPMKYLKYAYQILIILRIYCVGIAFIIYCRYNKKEDFSVLIGAIIYTFCGYIFYAAVRHPYFTNPAIMLPLVFLGIDKILKEDKYIFFTITIAVLAIMNYYFLYIITILAVIYAIIKYITEYKQNGIKDFGLKFAKTALCYIIGVMIAGIILLPTIYAFLSSDRAGVDYTYYGLGYYEKLIFGQPDAHFWSKSYVASILLIILPVAILNIKNNKENKTTLINIVISIIILFVPFLGSVMNGFSFQSNRWIFAYSFYMAYLVVINLRKDMKYTIKEIISMLISLVIYMILALMMTRINRNFVLISVFFASMIGLFILIKNIYKKHTEIIKKICKIAIVILVGANTIIYAWSVYSSVCGNYVSEFINFSSINKKYNSYGNKIKDFNKAIKYIKKNDSSFYRVGTPIYNNNNMSIRHDYKGLNYYLSIGNGYISNLSKDLLITGRNKTNGLNELDSRTKVTTLLGCKYYVVPNNKTSYVPYGYKKIKEYKNTKIYENQNNLTIGTFYDNYIMKEDYNNLSALEKEQALLDTAVLENDSEIKEKNVEYNENLINEIKDTAKEVNFKILDENNYLKDKKFDIKFEEVENSELYLYFEGLEYDSNDKHFVKVKYDNIEKEEVIRNKIADAYYEKTPNILFNLGYKEKHRSKITVELTGLGNYTCNNIKVIAVPMQKYKQSIAKLKQTEFNLQELGDDYIRGNINNDKTGILQIGTSYSKGWKAYVDGKETEVINVNTGFIGITLEKGEHEIYLKYYTPWLKTGIIISILGMLILVIMIINGKRRRKKKI